MGLFADFLNESIYHWRNGPRGKQVTIDGITLVAANLTREVGKRHWNLGHMTADGHVDWFESGSTLAEIEGFVHQAIINIKERT